MTLMEDDNWDDVEGSEDNDLDEVEEEFDPENESIVRAKWSFDGATTLSEAAQKLRNYADELIQMEKEGWQLTQPIEDDYGFIERRPQ